MEDIKKPHIQKLFDAFREYTLEMQTANYTQWEHARMNFINKLEQLGIAGMFDWSENA